MTTLYIEPFGGIAGDMLIGALLDFGDPRFTLADLRALAAALVPGECSIEVETAWRGSLSGKLVSVVTPESAKPPHRHLADCAALIESSPLAPSAKRTATAVFRRIAEAEARVHGCTVDEIHFHEVGAVDALIDVCGAALALERLAVERVLASPPLLGSGTVRCAHGEMPVPAPGTAEILRGLAGVIGGGPGERTTPTGAALLVELAREFTTPGTFEAKAIGYGAGHKDFREGPPNIVRVQLGELAEATARAPRTTVWLVEANLDDATGEEIGFLVERLRAAGALEVWTSAVQMKKDRPGAIVSALCRAEARPALETAYFAHSTTLGVRWSAFERTELARETLEVDLDGARIRVVRRIRPGGALGAFDLSAEHDDIAELARRTRKSLRELELAAVAAALRKLGR